MNTGIKFSQLGEGDILIDKNWSYRNLWGLAASKQKLKDQFDYSREMGFKIIFDKICPIYDKNNKLTLDGTGYNSNIWPLLDTNSENDRISIYKKEILNNKLNFICKLEYPENLNKNNINEYVNFFLNLVQNPKFSWIENWTFFENPEQMIYISQKDSYEPAILPEDYVNFLSKVRTGAKSINPSIKIGGPGLVKGIVALDQSNPLNSDSSFYNGWIKEAVNLNLLKNIDFFTLQLKQEIFGMDYDYVFSLSVLLKKMLSDNSEDEKIMPIYSLGQGRQELNKTSTDSLIDQAYYNVSEALNASKNEIIPIINCICDPPDDKNLNPNYDPKYDGYGLYRFDMTKKPQVEYFKFVLTNLKNYTTLTKHNGLYLNEHADDITFINNEKSNSTILSIIWPKHKKETKIVILPNADQYYILMDGTTDKIRTPYEFVSSREFIIVYQNLNTELIDYTDLKNTIFKKYMYNMTSRDNLLKALPVDYNTSIDNTNFYKILRSFALEYADLKVEVDTLKNNAYLNTADKQAIYQNFGSMVNLEKQYDWDYEKYRRLIQGVIKSLLAGPTKISIQEAINLFINYDSVYANQSQLADVKIYELYENQGVDPTIYGGIHTQFAFIVEVSKNIDVKMDQEILNRDLKYIINILKPAHTLSFVVIILSGTEDYKKQYYENHGIEFKNMDKFKFEGDMGGKDGTLEGKFGWKHIDYTGTFHTFDWKKRKHVSKLNGAIPIGPRKILNDDLLEHLTQNNYENYTRLDVEYETELEYCENWKDYYKNKYDKDWEGSDTDFEMIKSYHGENEHEPSFKLMPFMYMTNISKFPSAIPTHYDNNYPVKKSDPYRPLGVFVRTKDNSSAKMFRIVNGVEQIIQESDNF